MQLANTTYRSSKRVQHMKTIHYGLALFAALWLGISGGQICAASASDMWKPEAGRLSIADRSFLYGITAQSSCQGPVAIPMSCERPCPPPVCYPRSPPPCRMPCCPPNCEPMSTYQPQPCCEPAFTYCPPPCEYPEEVNCYDFYLGFYTYHLNLKANLRNTRGVDPFFGEAEYYHHHRLRGTLRGGTAGFEYNQPCGLYENLEFNWASGRVRNRHHHRQCNERFVHNYQAHMRLGWNWSLFCDNFSIIPYSGLGYRYVDHHVSRVNQSLRYRTFYIPVGLNLTARCLNFLEIGLNGEWLFVVDSEVKMSSWRQLRWILQKRQGFTIELPITYLWYCDQFQLQLLPFYRRFVDGSSKKLTYKHWGFNVRIPRQINQEWGGKVLLGFSF